MTGSESSLSDLSDRSDTETGGAILPTNLVTRSGTRGRKTLMDKVNEQRQSQQTSHVSSQETKQSSRDDSPDLLIHDSDDPRYDDSASQSEIQQDGSQSEPSGYDDLLAGMRATMMNDVDAGDADDEFFEGPGRKVMTTVDREDEGWHKVYEGLTVGVPLFFDQMVSTRCSISPA
jgi:hypothetical protein